jgi:hypothetical protein
MHLVFLRSVLQWLVIAYVVPNSLILFNLMMEALHSSETSVHTRATRRHITEDGILQHFHSSCSRWLYSNTRPAEPSLAIT